MKKIFVFASIVALAACNSKEPAKTDSMKSGDTTMNMTMRDINSPYPVGYSAKFAIDDPKNAETVLNLWKVWDAGDLTKARDMFADTLVMHLADGSMMKGPRDSIIAKTQPYRNSLGTVTSSVDVVVALKSTDKNEHWGLVWGMEKHTNKGKSDSSYLHEAWKFNSDGRADLMYQFSAAGAPPKKMK